MRTPTHSVGESAHLMSATLKLRDDTGVAILNRVIQPDAATITADAAQTLLSFKFTKKDEQRMNRLAEKARKGTLTDHEQAAAEQYNLVSHLLALLQAKARSALKSHSPDSTLA